MYETEGVSSQDAILPYMNFPKFPNYHVAVLWIYLLVLLSVVTQIPHVLVYEPSISPPALFITGATLLCLFFFVLFFRKGKDYPIHGEAPFIFCAIAYAFAFAIPEEILFRGITQGLVLSSFTPILSILLSSFIFGLAHILNSTKGVGPMNWNWQLVGVSFLGGIPLGTLFLLTGSLFLPTILHAVFLLVFQIFLSN